jgi:hypothetical protein
MNKQFVAFSALISSCVIIVLSMLYFLAPLPNRANNGFHRNILMKSLQETHRIKLDLQVSKLSGATQTRYYLNGPNPSWVLEIDTTLMVKDTLWFNVRQTEKFLSPNTFVDSPNIYMYAGNISYLVKGRVNQFHVDTLRLHTPVFLRSLQISPRLMIIRGFDSTNIRQSFKLIDCNNGTVIKEEAIIEDDGKFGFTTDGELFYDSKETKIVFVERYKNRFICLDTNLNHLYTGKTIDTVETPELKLKTFRGTDESKITPGNNRTITNNTATLYNGYLIINSLLKADNESSAQFKNNFALDVYEVADGKYVGTFYIPRLDENKISSIAVNNKQIIVLYQNSKIVSFRTPTFLRSKR